MQLERRRAAISRIADLPVLLLVFLVACSTAKTRNDSPRPPIWGAEALDDRAVQERHAAAHAAGDSVMQWLTGDVLSRLQPSESEWTDARNAAAEHLGKEGDVAELLKNRLNEAVEEVRKAERTALEEDETPDAVAERTLQQQVERLDGRLQFTAVHMTLLTEERERLRQTAGDSVSKSVRGEAARLEKKMRQWQEEREALAAKREKTIELLAGLRRSAGSVRERQDKATARLEQAREAKRVAEEDLDLWRYRTSLPAIPIPQEAFAAVVKGRASGSPFARGLKPRANTAEEDPRGSLPRDTSASAVAEPGVPAAVDAKSPPVEFASPSVPQPQEAPETMIDVSAMVPQDVKEEDRLGASSSDGGKLGRPAAGQSPWMRDESLRTAPAMGRGPEAFLYQVQRGDTLPSLAEKVYGSPNRWRDIYAANSYRILRGLLQPGQWLLIPGG